MDDKLDSHYDNSMRIALFRTERFIRFVCYLCYNR